MKIQTKTTLVLTLPIIVALNAFGILAYNGVRDEMVRRTFEELEAVSSLEVSQIETQIARYRDESRVLSAWISLQGPLPGPGNDRDASELQRRISAGAEIIPNVESVRLFGPSGELLASAGEIIPPTVAAQRPSISSVPAGVPVLLEPVYHDMSRTVRIRALTPVVRDDSTVALLEVLFDSSSLDAAIETAGFGETGEIVLGRRDERGDARFVTGSVHRPDAAGRLLATSDRLDVPMIQALRGVETRMYEDAVDYEGTPVFAVTHHLEDLDWGLIAKFDADEVLFTGQQMWLMLVGLTVLLSGAGAVAGLHFGRRLAAASGSLEVELEERKRAEQRFRRVVDTAPNAMLMVAPDGRITLVNERASHLLGYDRDSLLSLHVEDLVEPEHRQAHAGLREAFAGTREQRMMGRRTVELHARHKDGRPAPVDIGLAPIETPEGPMVLASLIDLTERQATELALNERAEALARSNRDLDEFAYIASHDLKAPLRGVDQLASFIEEDAGHLLPAESRQDLATLRARVTRMSLLLDGLLQYSRVGRRESEPEWIDMSPLLRGIADLYTSDDHFTVEIPTDLPHLFAPSTAVEVVFRNLIMNAVKHHDRGAGVIRVEGHMEDGSAVFSVSDDGPGIPPEYRSRIFQLFQTLRPRDEVEGSGMGLALVKRTVTAYGGTVEVVAREGRGATFRITWPQARRRAEEHAA